MQEHGQRWKRDSGRVVPARTRREYDEALRVGLKQRSVEPRFQRSLHGGQYSGGAAPG
jgi:hypothetical protein